MRSRRSRVPIDQLGSIRIGPFGVQSVEISPSMKLGCSADEGRARPDVGVCDVNALLDTRAVAPSERAEYWSAGIAQHFFPVRLEPTEKLSFEARLSGGRFGSVITRSIRGLPHRVVRDMSLTSSTDPDCLLLYLVRSGSCRITQEERSSLIGPGGIAFQDMSRPSVFEAVSSFDVAVFAVPRDLLGARADAIARHAAEPALREHDPLEPLAAPFLSSLSRIAELKAPLGEEGRGLAEMLAGMLQSLYGRDSMLAEVSQPGVLLMRMRQYALENLGDPRLGPEQIARAHFVSPRYVHKLFAGSGSGVSEWIREQRMIGAFEELSRAGGMPVAGVAERWGYRSPASFSRAFRQMHGRSPREVRGTR